MFPELRRLAGKLFAGSEPISLNLKTDGIGFSTTVTSEELRKQQAIWSILGGGLGISLSNETVTIKTALMNSVVFACNQIVAGTIGALPASIKQKTSAGIRDAVEHPLYDVVANKWNDDSTSQTAFEMETSHCLLSGNAYADVLRRSGTGVAIQLRELMPERVRPDREKTGQKRMVYVVTEAGASDKVYTIEPGKPQRILHLRGIGWDGIRGYSVIPMARNSIGMILAADRNVSRFWASGGRVPFMIEIGEGKGFRANTDDAKNFRRDLEAILEQPHRPPILEPGQKYIQTGLSMTDSQANEFRTAMISEVCRWFNVMPHLIGDLSRATFNNIEELALQFEKITLTNWLRRWRQEFHRCVLTPEEQAAGYYLHHNLDAMRRGDFMARMMGYASALQNGWLNRDEVRGLEDRNPIPGGSGQEFTIQSNMQTVAATTSQMQQLHRDRQQGKSAPKED